MKNTAKLSYLLSVLLPIFFACGTNSNTNDSLVSQTSENHRKDPEKLKKAKFPTLDKKQMIVLGTIVSGAVILISSPRLYRLAQFELDPSLRNYFAQRMRKNHGRFPELVRGISARLSDENLPNLVRKSLEAGFINSNTRSTELPIELSKRANAAYEPNLHGKLNTFRKNESVKTMNDFTKAELDAFNQALEKIRIKELDGAFLFKREFLQNRIPDAVHESAHHYFEHFELEKIVRKFLPEFEQLGLAKLENNQLYIDKMLYDYLTENFAFYTEYLDLRHQVLSGKSLNSFWFSYYKVLFDIDLNADLPNKLVLEKIKDGVIRVYKIDYPEITDFVSKTSIVDYLNGKWTAPIFQ